MGHSSSGQNNAAEWPLVNLGGYPPAWWQPLITYVNGGQPDAMVTRFNLYDHPLLVGLNEIEKRSPGFILYPNPSPEILYLKLEEDEKDLNVEVYNLVGEIVLSQECRDGNFKIDIKDLTVGAYIIKIKSSKKQYSGKFIKQ